MQGILDGIAAFINNLGQMITGPILSLAGLFVALIILILSLMVLWRIIKLSRSSNLIIQSIINATGNDALDKALLGLTQLARERLVRELEVVRDQLIEYKELGPEKPEFLQDLTALYSGDADNKLSDLLISLKDVTSGNIKTAVHLLNLVFIPRGTKVTITLQPCLKNTITTQLHSGISFEVKDLRGRQKPTLYTIWGPDRSSLEDVFSLEQYYADMLDPAMISLALELFQRVIASTKPRKTTLRVIASTKPRKTTLKEFQAQLFNYIGEFYLAYGDKYPFLYEMALWKFEQASKCNRNWSHPYENIGETYSSMSQYYRTIAGIEEACLREYIWKAIYNYNKALENISKEQTKAEEFAKKKHAERKIRINMARTYLIIADNINISNAKLEISQAKEKWDIDSEFDSRILYNLACWYENIDRLHIIDTDIPNPKQCALRYLTYSLVRDCSPKSHQDLAGWAFEDPEFEDIRAELEVLIPLIQKKLSDIPELYEWQGGDFVEELRDITEQYLNSEQETNRVVT